jgi:hypothetical protein
MKESEFLLFDKYNIDKKFKFPKADAKKIFQPKSVAEIIKAKRDKRSKNMREWLVTALRPIIAYRTENFTISNYL